MKAWIDAQVEKYQLNFWKTSSKIEVDFIFSGPHCLLAIEVKNGKTLHPKDFTGLKKFKEAYPEAQSLMLYRGNKSIKKFFACQ